MPQLTDIFNLPPAPRSRAVTHAKQFHAPTKAESRDFANPPRAARPMLIECVSVDTVAAFISEWSDLISRALEPNVFLAPAFALPAARHVSGSKQPLFLLVWEPIGPAQRGRLLALWPIASPRAVFRPEVRTWVHDYCCCGAPLLDKCAAEHCLDAIFGFLNESTFRPTTMATTQLPQSGPVFELLKRHAAQHRLGFEVVARYNRAVLSVSQSGASARDLLSPKKRKELQRQFRRLNEKCSVSFGMACEGVALRQQVEAFMILEAKGWKGRNGGAFLSDPNHAAFLRAMTQAMALDGRCRIYWMACGERVIASNIVLISEGCAHFWKTAYDEDFASASPGVLLTIHMTDALFGEADLRFADSCAIPDHPMINHIWRERLSLADILVALRADQTQALHRTALREILKRQIRDKAKSILAALRIR